MWHSKKWVLSSIPVGLSLVGAFFLCWFIQRLAVGEMVREAALVAPDYATRTSGKSTGLSAAMTTGGPSTDSQFTRC